MQILLLKRCTVGYGQRNVVYNNFKMHESLQYYSYYTIVDLFSVPGYDGYRNTVNLMKWTSIPVMQKCLIHIAEK